jgi:hypothetical protein
VAEGDQADAWFGWSVGTAGDVNGDGYSDLIIGAFLYDNAMANAGRVLVYHGSAAGLGDTPAWTAQGDQAGAFFGRAVGTAGDVNGDGYSDVIVGAPFYDNGEVDEGRVYVYHGSPAGLSNSPAWIVEGNQISAEFGFKVETAGDVNGDGFSDVIVSAHYFDNGQVDEGQATVYYGSPTGLSVIPDWTAEGDQAGAEFGRAVRSAGDVNADGYGDIAVGSPVYDNGQRDEGRVFVYHGSAGGLSTSADWIKEGDQVNAGFGWSVDSAGDVNGDGYGDLIIGAPFYVNGQEQEGGAFVYHGSAAGLSASHAWITEGDQAVADLGWSVGTVGDLNGDGYSDVVVGVPVYDNGEVNEGRAYIFTGGVSGLSTIPALVVEGDQSYAWLGISVGTAGDTDGDGFSDVILGAPHYDNGQTDEGRIYVFAGSSTGQIITPLANAGDDQIVGTGAVVTLDGSGSIDLDGNYPLSYLWTQTGGLAVSLSDPTAVAPTFTAPSVITVLTFTLAVTDSLGLTDPTPDAVVVTVGNYPIADAGEDQSIGTNAVVTLDGSGSSDPDGNYPLSYLWKQVSGPVVTLNDTTTVAPAFTAPSAPAVLIFTLTVTNSLGLVDPTPDQVIVLVGGAVVHHIFLPLGLK